MKHMRWLGICLLASGCATNGEFVDGDHGDAGTSSDSAATDSGPAAINDASEASFRSDAADGSPQSSTRISCGGGYCRADQQCTNGTCTTSCQGTSVPGDYATITEALYALNKLTTDATICLTGQTYYENITTSPSSSIGLTIRGPTGANINYFSIHPGYSKVSLEGFSIKNLDIAAASGNVNVVGMQADHVTIEEGATVVLDGCNLGAPGQSVGVFIDRDWESSPLDVTVKNSWIHDASSYGLEVYSVNSTGSAHISFINNTITSNGTGIMATGTPMTLTYANNIIAKSNAAAISIDSSVQSTTFKNNLLFANTANYAGTAVDGTGYVKADPKLDNEAPPALTAGSPAIGAADATQAPTTDYWGSSRGAAPDIGAVQGP